MEWTGLNELRERYLSFFESKDHLRLPSFSLVPQGDKSLLLINAGMAPLKKYFTGELTPPRARVTTCQKCIRTPDIERVGKTARHGTYFEMLGNFSFGDYFKREAAAWAWEFCTKVMQMDPARLFVSVFYEDDEAFGIWTKEIGVAEDHMVRLGREDNFWELGAGPCGPCSEIYYDRGEAYGCGSPDCKVGCDCDRYVEFWNLVFTQFSNDGNGNYSNLEKRNIDTGMGLERLACICQGVDNLFEVDTVQNIMKHVMRIAGLRYHDDAQKDVSLRVITDHIRSTTMLVGDGVLPSNEGRGYVLRRLLRRAARHGRLIGIGDPFLTELAETVIAENRSAYPILEEKKAYILRVIANEEENFGRTIDAGLQLLTKTIGAVEGRRLSGADAFKLADTYGFPIDLTREIVEEQGLALDEEGYAALALEQRERSRNARKDAGADGWKQKGLATNGLPETAFIGYESDNAQANILAIFVDGEARETVALGENALIVLDRTPFYPEGGGQTCDTGILSANERDFQVTAVSKTTDGVILHQGYAAQGDGFAVGDTVAAQINGEDRAAIRRNHTAAHLLHAALRKVLGDHVEQAGQSVTAKSVRFDYTHFEAPTTDQLRAVVNEINTAIWAAIPVETQVLSIEEAKSRGAMALFGEKYGETVRVVAVDGVSTELCGGTHARNTGNLGLFFVLYESSVASGVRRVEAVTAANTVTRIDALQGALRQTAMVLKTSNTSELETRAAVVMAELKQKEQEIAKLSARLAEHQVRNLLQRAEQIGSVRFVSASFDGVDAENLRAMCDIAMQSGGAAAALLVTKTDKGTLQFAAAASADAVKLGVHAGNLVRTAAQTAGGSGGGKPSSAMAGGKDPAKREAALEAGKAALEAMLNEMPKK
ncbi:MAG: alanine--tRNA ligase [Oscillospiraceae bacterium]|jgi:alanyl-tRNA synthetase|nr:alanine--tRNA ligase [Oscillospiraceae bacterium]